MEIAGGRNLAAVETGQTGEISRVIQPSSEICGVMDKTVPTVMVVTASLVVVMLRWFARLGELRGFGKEWGFGANRDKGGLVIKGANARLGNDLHTALLLERVDGYLCVFVGEHQRRGQTVGRPQANA